MRDVVRTEPDAAAETGQAFHPRSSGEVATRLAIQRRVIAHLNQGTGDAHAIDLRMLGESGVRERLAAYAYGAMRAWNQSRRYASPRASTVRACVSAVPGVQSLDQDLLRDALLVERYSQFAKRCVDTPRNLFGPQRFARTLVRVARHAGVTATMEPVTVEQLPACAAVARGGREQAALVTLAHVGDQRIGAPSIALCGKGVTFDAGGLGLKPQGSMRRMKADMAGGAAVAGAVMAASRLRIPVNVTAYIATAENAIGPSAQAPGDVVRYRSGCTVEVTDVDAEGRLMLADLCLLARDAAASHLITVGSLSEVVSWTVGRERAGLFSSDNLLRNHVIEAQEVSGESVWPLPLPPEHQALMEGGWVDLVNSAGPEFGGIQPALFLQRFTAELPWAHLEVSGPSWNPEWGGTGGTGYGVALLTEVLSRIAHDPAACCA